MSGIIDQPIYYDIWPIIFRNLSVNDLFNCRLVNKLFKNFSDHTNGINKLIIGQLNLDTIYDDYYWYYNYEQIEAKDIISLKCFRTIQKLSIFNLDKYLKYLKIYDQQFKLEEISNLINLESIEFGRYYENDNQQILNLNNLKVFASDNLIVELNTPKLEKLQFYETNRIKSISNPVSVKHLITWQYNNRFEIFKNLEIMELRLEETLLNKNILIIFKNLKKYKVNLDFHANAYYSDSKDCVIKILNDKVKLKRRFDIYLEDVKIENIDKFNELVSNKYPYWKFRLNNYDLLDLSFISDLTYSNLEECIINIKNDLPSSFFDKFFYIYNVTVDNVKDIDGLNWFLNKLKYLRRLIIYSKVPLDEVFYSNLPNTIIELHIYNQRKDINYDFILKLSKLCCFETDNIDQFDLVIKSFLNLNYLKYFAFYFKYKKIIIDKKNNDFYLNGELVKLDYNQLVDKCNEIRPKL